MYKHGLEAVGRNIGGGLGASKGERGASVKGEGEVEDTEIDGFDFVATAWNSGGNNGDDKRHGYC